MTKYFDEKKNEFIFENYHKNQPFASFLPGIAGKTGVPMWTYYVNRGQLISSFGIENKDHALLDFTPANLSYRRTGTDGFRTFIKTKDFSYEPFGQLDTKRHLKIGKNTISISEKYKSIDVEVKYFHVTNKNFPGLIRKVTIKSSKAQTVDFVDGLATFWPYGTSLFVQKNMSNLAVAWFDVFNQENRMPFMKNRSTTEDSSEVETVESGNFYVSVDANNQRLKPVFDPTCVFGMHNDLQQPVEFFGSDYDTFIKKEQVSVNQLLSAFSTNSIKLDAKASYSFYTLLGSYHDLDALNELSQSFSYEYFKDLEHEAMAFADELTNGMQVKTAYPLFDNYMKQSFLDNLLRGGYPYVFKGKDKHHVYHTFSRIHGDMEREYNNFFVEPAYFSHGNGSYRDVNQNRRNDVYFVPEAGLFNIRQFLELIQADGHNPLTIEGSRFIFDTKHFKDIENLVETHKELLKTFLEKPFTPGSLLMFIMQKDILVKNQEQLLEKVLYYSEQRIQSRFGTGYWSDHWIYNLDLIDLYLNIYPDRLHALLFDEKLRFFQSHMSVFNRSVKYVLNQTGEARQLGPIYHDHQKQEVLGIKDGTNFHQNDKHEIVRVQTYVKLLHLALIKLSSLDPFGMGVMMDGEKPGWNDAMNGLPAIFGSGLTETVVLDKLLGYLVSWTNEFKNEYVEIPTDIMQLFNQLEQNILKGFDVIQDIRENFDEKTRFYFDSKLESINVSSLLTGLMSFKKVTEKGLKDAKKLADGLLPTYLTYEAKSYEKTGKTHPELKLECIKVHEWSVRPLPHYLEAPAHYLKGLDDKKEAKEIYETIKKSEIYDQKLGLYKTSASLENETLLIGRARAFTKGWLEREASFVHMSYKYLIGILKSGLYDAYYDDMKSGMAPFMDPSIYGRSTLENVSFIATSNNPNPKNHGRGFVARLTGTTSEAITLAYLMFLGKHPFTYDGTLHFKVEPKLKGDFFKNNIASIKFLSDIEIEIHNQSGLDTFNQKVVKYELINRGKHLVVDGSQVSGELAELIRQKAFKKIKVFLE